MNNEVVLKIIRRKSFIGAVIPFTVLIDDINVGSLKNNGSITCNIAYGKHKVVIKALEKDVIEEIDVLENTKEIEITCVAKFGIVAAVPKIESKKII